MSNVKKIAIVLPVVLVLAGVSAFVVTSKGGSESETKIVESVDEGRVDANENVLEDVTRGVANKDPRGYEFDNNLIDFMDKLNEVNLFVFDNLASFESGADIDEIFRNLWLYGEAYGFRMTAILTQEALDAGDNEYTPQSAAFINILTKDGVNYCAVDERVLNPDFDQNQALQQSLLFYSCEEYINEYRKIFEEEQALAGNE
jgi:hypothetical protein